MTSTLTGVKDRLRQFLTRAHISNREFTQALGVSEAYIGAMRKSLSPDKLRKLQTLYPELNLDWLLHGEGEMFTGLPARNAKQSNSVKQTNPHVIPILPVDAFAGRLQEYSQGVGLQDCPVIVSPVKGADFAIRVSGDSMEPKIHDGTTILIKRINEKSFIPWGTYMVIDSENGALVKEVWPGNDDNTIRARSINPRYPDIDIPRESIYGLYRVLGAIQIFSTM